MNRNVQRAIDDLPFLREDVTNIFGPESCVASVRILIDVLDYFDVYAEPLSVRMVATNAEMVQHRKDNFIGVDLRKVTKRTIGGPWSVDLGIHTNQQGAGHVVAWLPGQDLMIDPSIDQAERPHKSIVELPKVYTRRPPFEMVSNTGTVIRYTISDQESYKDSLNWRRRSTYHRKGVFKKIVGGSIKRIKQETEREVLLTRLVERRKYVS